MDLTEQEYNKIEKTLEERAKNEVIMEFDVDEATYHKLMRKLRPDNYKEYVSAMVLICGFLKAIFFIWFMNLFACNIFFLVPTATYKNALVKGLYF